MQIINSQSRQELGTGACRSRYTERVLIVKSVHDEHHNVRILSISIIGQEPDVPVYFAYKPKY